MKGLLVVLFFASSHFFVVSFFSLHLHVKSPPPPTVSFTSYIFFHSAMTYETDCASKTSYSHTVLVLLLLVFLVLLRLLQLHAEKKLFVCCCFVSKSFLTQHLGSVSDMCYLTKHFPERFQSHLFECEAFDPPAAVVRQVRMWSLARCDARRDCRREGEEGEDKCDESFRAENAGGVAKYSRINVRSLVLFLHALCGNALFLFKKMMKIRFLFVLQFKNYRNN